MRMLTGFKNHIFFLKTFSKTSSLLKTCIYDVLVIAGFEALMSLRCFFQKEASLGATFHNSADFSKLEIIRAIALTAFAVSSVFMLCIPLKGVSK